MKLEIGYNHPIEVRNYSYPFGPLAGKKILYISDIHYHRLSAGRVERHIRLIREICPDILLLGGDYIDTPFGLPCLRRFLGGIGSIPAFAIGGNHDGPYLRSVRRVVEEAGVTWVHHDSAVVRLGDARVRIDGTRPAVGVDRTAGEDGAADFSILCLHHPIDVRPLAHRYNLVFAGHLHGGQIVLWQTPDGLYPLRWRYRWNRLGLKYGDCRYLISKGLGDTLPVRCNCPRDVIVVRMEDKSNIP